MKDDTFDRAVLDIPEKIRCVQSSSGRWNMPLGYCFFGVPEDKFFGWSTFRKIPSETKGLNFYLGSKAEKLFDAFSKSVYTRRIEHLCIGDSSFGFGNGMDYSNVVKILEKTLFPKVKVFKLGVWDLFSNSHHMYGKLGNLDRILRNMPNLEELELGGNFEITEPLYFRHLKKLTINLDDCVTGVNGGYINNNTLVCLLESSFSELREMYLNLECGNNDYGYNLPNLFLSGDNVPKLEKFDLSGGFLVGEKTKIKNSIIFNKIDLRGIDDIVEVFESPA